MAQWLKWWFPVLKVHSRYGILAHCSRISHDVWGPLSKYGSLIMKRGNQKKGHCHSKYIFHPWTKISSSQTCQSCADTKPKDSYPNGFLAKPGRPSVRLRDFALAPPLSNPFCVLYGRTLLPFKSFTLSPVPVMTLGWARGMDISEKTRGLNRAFFFEIPNPPKKSQWKTLKCKNTSPTPTAKRLGV